MIKWKCKIYNMSNLEVYQKLTPIMPLELIREQCQLFNKQFVFEILHPISVDIYNMLINRLYELILGIDEN